MLFQYVVRLFLATWIVLLGIVFALEALQVTDAHVSPEWTRMAMAVICVKTGMLIAAENRLPF